VFGGRQWRGRIVCVRLLPIPGVHRPRSDTWLLADVLRREDVKGHSVADLCTGSGALAIRAAQAGAKRVLAVDVSRRATLAARCNASLNGCRVETRRGDMFAVLEGERFDAIVCNPPYVPAATDALPRHRASTPLDAGRDGRALLDRICREAGEHICDGGSLLLVQSSICGVEETCERLRAAGLHADVCARMPGALGPVMRERAPMLRARGLLADEDLEELVVIRGRA
jgi:release factor glutamine methyltransferase